MKKLIMTLLLCLAIATGLALPKKSEAIVTSLYGPAYLAALSFAATLGVPFYIAENGKGTREERAQNAGIAMLIGLIALDSDTGIVSFKEISKLKAEELGIDDEEKLKAYNGDAEEMTMLNTLVASSAETEQERQELWKEYQKELSPETLEILKSIFSK